jgi:hypothetical protein
MMQRALAHMCLPTPLGFGSSGLQFGGLGFEVRGWGLQTRRASAVQVLLQQCCSSVLACDAGKVQTRGRNPQACNRNTPYTIHIYNPIQDASSIHDTRFMYARTIHHRPSTIHDDACIRARILHGSRICLRCEHDDICVKQPPTSKAAHAAG